jgi:hypothetical protein
VPNKGQQSSERKAAQVSITPSEEQEDSITGSTSDCIDADEEASMHPPPNSHTSTINFDDLALACSRHILHSIGAPVMILTPT